MANGNGGRRPGAGRPLGAKGKFSSDVKAMILGALSDVGGQEYLARQANANPVAFMSLLGKVLPLQLANADENKPLRITFEWADAGPTIEHESNEHDIRDAAD